MSLLVHFSRAERGARAACLLALGLVACAGARDDSGFEAEVADDDAPPNARLSSEAPEQAQLIAKVDAFGSGCPVGRWESVIDQERRGFTVFFEAYTLALGTTDLVKTLNCTVTVDVDVPAGTSYAISTFSYDGPALLESGMEGRIETRYTFLGQAESPVFSHRITGPWERLFTFVDEVPMATRTWSSCAAYRQLQIRSQMILKNGSSPGSGEMSLAHLDGSSTGKLRVELATKACPGSR